MKFPFYIDFTTLFSAYFRLIKSKKLYFIIQNGKVYKFFKSLFMALGDGRHNFPVNTGIIKIIKKEEGDNVTIVLKERIKEK